MAAVTAFFAPGISSGSISIFPLYELLRNYKVDGLLSHFILKIAIGVDNDPTVLTARLYINIR
jgi:hypothetical protein